MSQIADHLSRWQLFDPHAAKIVQPEFLSSGKCFNQRLNVFRFSVDWTKGSLK